MNANGIGLGLVISENLVKQFKGRIDFESEINQGSTFTFYLRINENQEEFASLSRVQEYKINSNTFYFNWRPDHNPAVE